MPYFFSVVVWVELLYFLLLYALLKCLGPLTVYAPCIRAELYLDQAVVVGVTKTHAPDPSGPCTVGARHCQGAAALVQLQYLWGAHGARNQGAAPSRFCECDRVGRAVLRALGHVLFALFEEPLESYLGCWPLVRPI